MGRRLGALRPQAGLLTWACAELSVSSTISGRLDIAHPLVNAGRLSRMPGFCPRNEVKKDMHASGPGPLPNTR